MIMKKKKTKEQKRADFQNYSPREPFWLSIFLSARLNMFFTTCIHLKLGKFRRLHVYDMTLNISWIVHEPNHFSVSKEYIKSRRVYWKDHTLFWKMLFFATLIIRFLPCCLKGASKNTYVFLKSEQYSDFLRPTNPPQNMNTSDQ